MQQKVLLSAGLVVIAFIIFAFLPESNNKIEPINERVTEGTGIHFIEDDWNKALSEAKKQNKLIFFDAYASWCGPCKMLKRKTFTDRAAGDFFNKNYISVAVDMEKGMGPSLSDMYNVSAYPTLIIIDTTGKPVTYTQGYMSPKELIKFGEFGLKQKIK
ncbi:MAG: thioredoxin family protein [Chitinophagaceae bacterium]|nr:thioredoxin family protein [Chitinophagaceae bacterium]